MNSAKIKEPTQVWSRSNGSSSLTAQTVPSKPGSEASITIGIPAYNTERDIAKVIVNAKQYSDKIIVCDDGSSDDTGRIAKSLGCEVITHQRNMGYGAAIRTILEAAANNGAAILVTVDGDGQHDPGEISSLIGPLIDGHADIVIGTRFSSKSKNHNMPKIRKAGIRSITWLVGGMSKQNISDAQSGFRAYNKKALSLVRPGEQGMGASTEILLNAMGDGLKILEVPATISYRSTNRPTLSQGLHFADVVASTVKIGSIRHPLLFFGFPALLALAASMFFGIWDLDIYSQQGRLVTNLTLLSAGTAIIGTILAVTGLLISVLGTIFRENSTQIQRFKGDE